MNTQNKNHIRHILIGTLIVLLSGAALYGDQQDQPALEADQQNQPASKVEFEVRNIEGWTVYINKKDLAQHRDHMDRVLDHLQNQLYQILWVVPPAAITRMQELVPIWVEYDELGTAYHPERKWLTDRGHRPPEGLGSMVGFCDGKDFLKATLHQPWVALHELSHGYDYQFIGGGKRYSNATIKTAYKRAAKSGTYDSVLCRYSTDTEHYAKSNEMEYLAENTEAYFGINDFYPFVRAELRQHDPHVCRLLENLWGVDTEQEARKTDSLARFLELQSYNAVFSDTDSPPITADGRNPYIPTSQYQQHQIEGWTVYVNPQLQQRIALSDKVLKLLKHKFHMIKRYVPEKSLPELQKVAIWVELQNPAVPYITYHDSEQTLESQHQNPDKYRAVEIGNIQNFTQWAFLQPFMLLNQLARAYHDQVLGYDNAQIESAHQKALESGNYDLVLRFDGLYVPHPALTNAKEYFAEMTEAYYGFNDHYPFIQFELKQYDPEICELLAKLWQGGAR